ncbi:hypothetical protein RND81_07G093500 [Saponaria officinalis]|uniref:Secreted protein n=1 Tax=Saponaria officinalis TaxID=3572 RepID=A0AAW1JPB4_SAPOF
MLAPVTFMLSLIILSIAKIVFPGQLLYLIGSSEQKKKTIFLRATPLFRFTRFIIMSSSFTYSRCVGPQSQYISNTRKPESFLIWVRIGGLRTWLNPLNQVGGGERQSESFRYL